MRVSAPTRAWFYVVLLVSISAVCWITQSGQRESHEGIGASSASVQEEAQDPNELKHAPTSTTRVAVDEPALDAAPKNRISRWGRPPAKGGVQGFIRLHPEDADAKCEVATYKRRDYPFPANKIEVQSGGSFTLKGKLGTTHDMRVRASGHGAAYIPSVTFSEPATVLAGPIQLRGPGAIRVHVFDGDGKPTIGFQVTALHAGDDDVRRTLWLSGDGLLRDTVVTDSDGRAELRGLAPGSYMLGNLVPDPVPADGRTVEIRHAIPQILVRVAELAADEFISTQPDNPLLRLPWCSGTVIDVARVDSVGGLDIEEVRKRSNGKHEVLFSVSAGHRYRIYSHGGPRPPHFIDVDVPIGSGRITVDLNLPNPVPTGRLTLVYPGPAPVQSGRHGNSYEAELFSVVLTSPGQNTFRSIALIRRSNQNSNTFDMPQGRYAFDVTGIESWLDFPRRFGAHRGTVDIRAGDETTLVLASLPCAHLELTTNETEPAQDPAYPVSLEAQLIHASGSHEWLEFEHNREYSETKDGEAWYLGEQLRTSSLGSGTYRLRVELEDGRVREQDVLLTPGGTTRVNLEFPPAPPPRVRPERRWW